MWECYWDSDQIEGSLHSPKKNLMTMTSVENAFDFDLRFAALVVFGDFSYVFVRIGRNFCLMASSSYGCFDWILLCKILTSSYDAWNALWVHTASEIHSPLWIRENARSWLSDWSKPTDVATKSGQTPMTQCGVMVSGNCEWCHRRRLMSWVTCHSKQVENVTFEVVTSGKSKFQTVEKYLNSLNRTACSAVQYISIEGRYVTVINRDIRMYCGRFAGPSRTAHGWSPCFIRIIHARIQNWTVCYNGVHTHRHTHTCSEQSYRILMWNASYVQNQFH